MLAFLWIMLLMQILLVLGLFHSGEARSRSSYWYGESTVALIMMERWLLSLPEEERWRTPMPEWFAESLRFRRMREQAQEGEAKWRLPPPIPTYHARIERPEIDGAERHGR